MAHLPEFTNRIWRWNNRTHKHLPLELQELPLESLPPLPEDCQGVNLSRTQIVDPNYPAGLPSHILSLQHASYQGTSLQGLDGTHLENLSLHNCPNLTSLGTLPPTLRRLHITQCPNLTSLPELPPRLEWIQVVDCPKLESLPSLPDSLLYANFYGTSVQRLPRLSPQVKCMVVPTDCKEARLLAFRTQMTAWGYPIELPHMGERLQLLHEFQRSQARMACWKEELVAAMWHPRRVARWLEADVLDMMLD